MPMRLRMIRTAATFVVNGDTGTLTVIDPKTNLKGELISQLPIGAGTDAVASDPKPKLIFSSNGIDGTLSSRSSTVCLSSSRPEYR